MIEFVFFSAIGFIIGFSIAKISKIKKRSSVQSLTEKNELHGHNLDIWQYLGYVILTYGKTECPVFLFCKKNDYAKRSYKITGPAADHVGKYHGYVLKLLDPWKTGEAEIYTYAVNGRSKWLNDFMLENFNCVWNPDTEWWSSTDAVKYASSKARQQKSRPRATTTTENVIKLDFGEKENGDSSRTFD